MIDNQNGLKHALCIVSTKCPTSYYLDIKYSSENPQKKKNTIQKCKHQGGNKTKGKTDISQYLCHKMDLFYASACGSKLPDDKKIRSSMVPTDRSEAE
jgi:hypothetical protein